MKKFFGKYRGKVSSNVDPMQLGRVQVIVPSVLGDGSLSWAMPSVPYAGKSVGFFFIPPAKANIWVEFEGGDPDFPIWTGCFWGVGEVPASPAMEHMKVIKTKSTSLIINDMPGTGGVTLEVKPPAVKAPLKIDLNKSGIEINCNPAKIKLTVNGMELEVPPSKIALKPANLKSENGPSSIKLSSSGVESTNGPAKISMKGPKVDINNGSAEII